MTLAADPASNSPHPLVVFLDRQHAGKTSKLFDAGAWCDFDQDGVASPEEKECYLTAQYALHAEGHLRAAGIPTIILSDGAYAARHARVADYCRKIPAAKYAYVACHLNAGGGAYGAVFHDARSTGGLDLANHLANALVLDAFKPCGVSSLAKTFPARADDWTKNALSTIAGIYSGGPACGVCFEPAFIDARVHRPLLNVSGLKALGFALANGVCTWAGLPMFKR